MRLGAREMKDRRIAIIGAGPVGGILAAHLARTVADPALVDINKSRLEAISEKGLRITGARNFKSRIARLFPSIGHLEEYDPDVVVIATKTWTLSTLLPELEGIHRPQRIYVVAQNGLDNELEVIESFGAENTLRMVVNYAGNPLAPGVLKMTFFVPPNYIGGTIPGIRPLAGRFADLLTSAGLVSEYSRNLRRYIWEKTIMNAAMNPICSLTRQNMYEVMQCEGTRTFFRRVMRESVTVANAEGFDFDEDFIQSCMAYTLKAGRHKPSMLLDVENGLPTEVDSLSGRIVLLGKKLGVPTPYNEGLSILIHGIEAAGRVCKGFRIGSKYRDEDGHIACGACPYDFEHAAILSNARLKRLRP